MADTANITAARLREVLHYNPETGLFTWIKRPSKVCRIRVGDIAGCLCGSTDYVRIRIDKVLHLAQRLAWLYMTGVLPKEEVDHRDTIRSNNRWNNLRKAKHCQNGSNRPKQANNSSGHKGVSRTRRGNRWRVQGQANGQRRNLGVFDTKEKAAYAYKQWAIINHGEFARIS